MLSSILNEKPFESDDINFKVKRHFGSFSHLNLFSLFLFEFKKLRKLYNNL